MGPFKLRISKIAQHVDLNDISKIKQDILIQDISNKNF